MLGSRTMSGNFAFTTNKGKVGVPRFELGTSSLSATRSNQLSYTPEKPVCRSRASVDSTESQYSKYRHKSVKPSSGKIGYILCQPIP